jgi:hypothetical protein
LKEPPCVLEEDMIEAAPSVRKRVEVRPDPLDPRSRRARSNGTASLGWLRRAQNQKDTAPRGELRCERADPACRKTFPAAAVDHRGAPGRLIVAPTHVNGATVVRVADRFFVVEPGHLARRGGGTHD